MVRHFVEDGVAPTEHVVTIMNFKSVYDLKTEIQALTNVAPDDQLCTLLWVVVCGLLLVVGGWWLVASNQHCLLFLCC